MSKSDMATRAKRKLREMGYIEGTVEKFVRFPPPGHSVDLFNIIDIIAVKADEVGVSGIQVTSGSNLANRVKKSLQEPRLATWLAAGNRFEAWGYRKAGKAGERKLWKLRRMAFLLVNGEITYTEIEGGKDGNIQEEAGGCPSGAVLPDEAPVAGGGGVRDTPVRYVE